MIESLVKKLQEEGNFSGSGGFTVDRLRRSQSLFGMQLRAPFQYLLKLVQTAVRAGSQQVDFNWNSHRIEVAFQAVLANVLDKGQHSLDGWPGHLERCLLLLPLVESRNFELVIADQLESQSYSPGGLRRGPALPQAGLRLRVDRPSSHRWKFWESRKFEQRLKQTLESALAFCTIQVTANGQWLNPGRPEKSIPPAQTPPRPGWAAILARPCPTGQPHGIFQAPRFRCSNYLKFQAAAQSTPTLFWGERVAAAKSSDWMSMVTLLDNPEPVRFEKFSIAGSPLPWEKVPAWLADKQACLLDYQQSSLNSENKDWYQADVTAISGLARHQAKGFPICQALCFDGQHHQKLHCPPLAVDRLAMLPWIPGGECKIFPLLDGVLLEPIVVTQGLPGAAAVIAASDWRTDLDQTRAVEDHNLTARLDWAVDSWNLLLLELQDILSSPTEASICCVPPETVEGWRGYFEALD